MAATCKMVTATTTVKASPGLLFAAVLTHSGAAQISVQDGAVEIFGMRLGAAGTVVFAPPVPVVFSSLIVTLDAGTAPEISVVYV